MLHKMKTIGLGEPVKVLEPLENHIEEDNEGRHYTMRIRFWIRFESMSIGTQFSDSLNEGNIFPPYIISYGQPSSHPSNSISEEYGMINYPHDPQMPFQIPYQMQQGFQISMRVNPEFPINGEVVGRSQQIYAWHVQSYN